MSVPAHDGNLSGNPDRALLAPLRRLILDTAAALPAIGAIEESVKWGEPSYAPQKKRIGSSVRLARRKDGKVSMNFICHTGLIGRFRELYTDRLAFEGNRSVIIDPDAALPEAELRHCIAMALTCFRKS